MLVKNYGAASALTSLVVIAVIGFLFFDTPHCYSDKSACISQYHNRAIYNNSSEPLLSVFRWAVDNRAAVEVLAGLAPFSFLPPSLSSPWSWLARLAVCIKKLLLCEHLLTNSRADILRSVKAAEIAAEAAKSQAGTAETQNAIAATQTDILAKQHEIGRLQFLATHRPRLRIRHVNVREGLHIGHPTLFFSHGAEIQGGLAVVNVGGSAATIVDTRYRIFFSKSGLPAAAPYDTDFRINLLLPDQILEAGESCATPIFDKIVMERPEPGIDVEMRKFERENWEIFVMGQIRYRDDGGAERFMGFCRRRTSDGRFVAVNDPDYEYED